MAKEYDPQTDSSDKTRALQDDLEGVILLRDTEDHCPCGCNQPPKGKTTVFGMGHDQRLKGKLIRAYVAGADVHYVDANRNVTTATAMLVAKGFQWEHYLTDAKARLVAKPTPKAKGPRVGDRTKITVGRWTYDAIVVRVNGTEVAYEYTTKKGERKEYTAAKAA